MSKRLFCLMVVALAATPGFAQLTNGDFEYWSDHPDDPIWAYVTTIQDDPAVGWYAHENVDGWADPWIDDGYGGYGHIIGTNGDRVAVISWGDTMAIVSQDLGMAFVAGETYTFSIDIYGESAAEDTSGQGAGQHWCIGIGTDQMSNQDARERQRAALAIAASNAIVGPRWAQGDWSDYTVLDPPDVFAGWQTRSVHYTATPQDAGKEIVVFFSGGFQEVGADPDTCFDNAAFAIGPLDPAVAAGLRRARTLEPADGAQLEQTWANLQWAPGDGAVSHNLYFGENLDDVSDGKEGTFVGNLVTAQQVVGLPGFPVPEGLQLGATYYWRIDEVNDVDPNNPSKGDLWSFSVQPTTAHGPVPSDGGESVALDTKLSWAPGFGAKLHSVYFGESYDEVDNAAGGALLAETSYTPPGPLELAKVYYWRVDEFDPPNTYKGAVWSFTTEGTAADPNPPKGAVDVSPTPILRWTPASLAASHEVYFGTDADAVKNAGGTSLEHKGTRALGEESYDAGRLELETTYYWRIDEVNGTNAGSPWIGNVWSFTTGDFLVVDDFESYDDVDPLPGEPGLNRIFDKWIDGFGVPTNGATTAEELPPYAEQTIVRTGTQSMKYLYDTNMMTSESTLTLAYPKDWTEEGGTKLSLWFRGSSGNTAERMFVALDGSAVVYHDNPAASQMAGWNEWVIDLSATGGFADQGVDLTDVNTMTIGFGTKNVPGAGGAGTVYFDDIRLYR